MTVAQLALALYLSAGALAFSAWCVRAWATRELKPDADLASRLVWESGRVFVFLAALVIAGGIAAMAARAAWRVLGG